MGQMPRIGGAGNGCHSVTAQHRSGGCGAPQLVRLLGGPAQGGGGILGEILVIFFFGFGLRILGKTTMRIFGLLDFPRLLLCSFG